MISRSKGVAMILYVKTTLDEYELPLAVAESPKELAKMTGTNVNVILSSLSHKRKGWYRIEVDDLDEDTEIVIVKKVNNKCAL